MDEFLNDKISQISSQECSVTLKIEVDLITHFKRFVCTSIAEISRSALRSRSRSPTTPVSRLSLCFVSTFIQSFICMNSNYVERLSAVSGQTRILLHLEDEINARPINSTLPSSLPLFALPTSHPAAPSFLPWPCWMILLDYTITADRLCLTFGSARK